MSVKIPLFGANRDWLSHTTSSTTRVTDAKIVVMADGTGIQMSARTLPQPGGTTDFGDQIRGGFFALFGTEPEFLQGCGEIIFSRQGLVVCFDSWDQRVEHTFVSHLGVTDILQRSKASG